ncbi:hypothetical protein DPMN_144460 [Dreissena polymorpha]|uniref:Uncharacterized protein n=1 Tax=Dreissena polymorpha TaxID=45954 RepID=A0A9D4GIB5_DREPO|nr:hypothetical protein DPMN_144460 [Dreissena polymorpha]
MPLIVVTCEECETSAATCEKSNHCESYTYLNGSTMSHFFNIWNRKDTHKPLGRGKIVPSCALTRQNMYRQCGCLTRSHEAKHSCKS